MIDSIAHPILPDGDTGFTVEAASMKFGRGVLAELGNDAKGMGMRRVALFTDPLVAGIAPFATALESLKAAGLDVVVYDRCRVEPTSASFLDAAAFARDGGFDGYISIGGGSVIDTAKAANLFATHPADFLAYVNKPLGEGRPVPGPVKPHIACPTTCGTGSETTGVAIFDHVEKQVKTGISSRYLRPNLAVVDPATIDSLPPGVIASTGFDVLTHAIESHTARPYRTRPRPDAANPRPPYQGANPWSDIGSLQAIRLGGQYLERAVNDPSDEEARDALMFAATLAGLAFGNAGVHIPHAMSYSVAGMNHNFTAIGYEKAEPMVPHGVSVVLNAPAAFRFTGPAAPERHLRAADALGADVRDVSPADGGAILAARLIAMMKATHLPNGLSALGYSEADIPGLVRGAIAQQRLLTIAPRPVTEDDLRGLYADAMAYW
ncbi:hydroxyacid-oxoacid transhydrogenase [Azospirillum rugosum]|uniref:hydroxyacid-oxoacid transhydrogenase n=1 Tax=Azospirillum rugosum TaxID=416170 RepID=A0ABS4SNU8_9PROT|nr:hydroxyacid-oxoacid transhydrogenase [Azospirillum rugosum]MBP2294230.1 alcohol dehydrogenase class IV [Azospirillum rugosum]MDQ0527381.1 alcohol dehydrogenase class IV [Azospirillum rugosum]